MLIKEVIIEVYSPFSSRFTMCMTPFDFYNPYSKSLVHVFSVLAGACLSHLKVKANSHRDQQPLRSSTVNTPLCLPLSLALSLYLISPNPVKQDRQR